jgi:3-deoxy-manno-octulosonate cytidylyltransferase (CMP-KDO synthetase)
MKVIGVIPARFGSTRFPGKPLKPILGKPLLQWVVEGVKNCRSLSEVIVATDHHEIMEFARSLGVKVAMTAEDLPSGTDRAYAATLNEKADVVVNIQGDEPLIEASVIDALVKPFQDDPALPMATLARALKPGDLDSPNTAKIVLNHRQEALYFSRFPIPFSRGDAWSFPRGCVKHIGLYAYRPDFLKLFCAQSPVDLEKAEGLEQLRALYLGARIKVVMVEHESWGVDTPEDVARVEELLKNRKA